MITRILYAGLTAVAVPCLLHAQADTSTRSVPSELTIHLSGGTVSANYATVVVDLASAGQLPLRPVVDIEGRTPQQILDTLGQLPFGTVPPELDRFLCRVNTHVCDMKGTRGVWTNQKAPPGAVTPERCLASSLPNYVLCVPNLRVDWFVSITTIKYKDGVDEPISRIVTDRTEGCKSWNAACQKEVAALNADTDWKSRGELVVPAMRLTVRMPLGSLDHFERLKSVLDRSIARMVGAGQFRADNPRVVYTVSNGPLKASGGLAAATQPPVDSRDILMRMQYPYKTLADFDAAIRERAVIAVWDQRVDSTHCDFKLADGTGWAFVKDPDNLPVDDSLPMAPPHVAACGEARQIAQFRSPLWDHGPGIVGVIAARENGRGIVGAHPRAVVWAMEFSKKQLEGQDPIRNFGLQHGHPKVLNFSLEDENAAPERTNLEEYIERWKAKVLFTIAAGNNGKQVNRNKPCRFVPGCLSASGNSINVVTVVALATDGNSLLAGTNASNHGTAFDVAAIGVTTTTLHGDATGTMEGTSFAAPYVASLAALLSYSDKTLTPEQVRERILYTADFHDSLDVLARFGRINFRRALDVDKDSTVFKPGFHTAVDGRREIVKAAEKIAVESATEDGAEVDLNSLDLKKVRRIRFDEVSGKYWVVFIDAKGIRKLDRVTFHPEATMTMTGAPALKIKVNDIQDFTCALECR